MAREYGKRPRVGLMRLVEVLQVVPRQIAGTPITRIGEITRSRQIRLLSPDGKSHPLQPGGWQHFA